MTDRRPAFAGVEFVDQAITSRRSVRAFLSTPVAREGIEAILDAAHRVPLGNNTQPWRVYVLAGEPKARLSELVLAAYAHPEANTVRREEYPYCPRTWIDLYQSRRREVGWDLYSLLGIGCVDKECMYTQHTRNFWFFGTPVGVIFTIDRVMEQGSQLDYGMFLRVMMAVARVWGIDTCPQAAFTQFHWIIAEQLGLTDNEMIICGMLMGYASRVTIGNTLITERAPVSKFTCFLD